MLGDQRRKNQGNQPLLSDVQQAQLRQVLQEAPTDGGLWTGAKVAAWMSQLLGRPICAQRGWDYLTGLRLRLRTPRPQHNLTDIEQQEAWKKKFPQEVTDVQTAHPDTDVEAWAMDEHRVGLKPVLRFVWVAQGEQPIAHVNWRFEWLWLLGFVHPNEGQTYWWILPYVRIDLFNRVLADASKPLRGG